MSTERHPLHFVLVSANSDASPLAIRNEVSGIAEAFARGGQIVTPTHSKELGSQPGFWVDGGDVEGARNALANRVPDIAQFSGHADGADLWFTREGTPQKVNGSELRTLLTVKGKTPRLVVLHACQTLPIAWTLLRSSDSIDLVLATSMEISDRLAPHFSRLFYAELLRGESLRQAVAVAALGAQTQTREERYGWVCGTCARAAPKEEAAGFARSDCPHVGKNLAELFARDVELHTASAEEVRLTVTGVEEALVVTRDTAPLVTLTPGTHELTLAGNPDRKVTIEVPWGTGRHRVRVEAGSPTTPAEHPEETPPPEDPKKPPEDPRKPPEDPRKPPEDPKKLPAEDPEKLDEKKPVLSQDPGTSQAGLRWWIAIGLAGLSAAGAWAADRHCAPHLLFLVLCALVIAFCAIAAGGPIAAVVKVKGSTVQAGSGAAAFVLGVALVRLLWSPAPNAACGRPSCEQDLGQLRAELLAGRTPSGLALGKFEKPTTLHYEVKGMRVEFDDGAETRETLGAFVLPGACVADPASGTMEYRPLEPSCAEFIRQVKEDLANGKPPEGVQLKEFTQNVSLEYMVKDGHIQFSYQQRGKGSLALPAHCEAQVETGLMQYRPPPVPPPPPCGAELQAIVAALRRGEAPANSALAARTNPIEVSVRVRDRKVAVSPAASTSSEDLLASYELGAACVAAPVTLTVPYDRGEPAPCASLRIALSKPTGAFSCTCHDRGQGAFWHCLGGPTGAACATEGSSHQCNRK